MRQRSRFRRSACAAASAATIGLALIAGSARADDSTLVPVLACAGDGGSVTVPAGDVTLRLGGYAEGTLGLIKDVLLAQKTTLAVGGTTYDLSGRWSAPVFRDGFWVIFQPNRDIGALAAAQSVTVTYDVSFSRPVAVLYPPVGSSGANGPFVITEDGPFTCTITAT